MNRFLVIICLLLTAFACKSPEARRPISAKSGSFIDQSVERNKNLINKERAVFETLMAKDSVTDYIASNSGFWYYYQTKVADSLITPDFGDIVTYNYTIKDINETVIYSKADLKTQTYIMDKQELFTGLREGLKLMREGETVTFLFPSQKAYGYYGDENKIGTNVPLICEVSLIDIKTTEPN
ncbi:MULTISPECIES: gliding motility-associated peptidyl-prolyl isomerase GldI [Bizionia]|uniref:Peptidyl-prolyl cis-trans isomerase n=1 Tax=Bizionia algoritergicola TaxID=291187 RepID=A0A5D0QS35_9FLAO|nr:MULTISPECIES: gliding motility-associated peptidyl-prolyl isomerase GldI [Bizionia]OBX21047.1 gliding motility-associated peptidyl-prolyl isomerase GldI [Bizionia sp. APA-3]TYB71686.1 gliding motility-associated peptidyl-prolyl isomerase GldI [Bizionia algoritergicola]